VKRAAQDKLAAARDFWSMFTTTLFGACKPDTDLTLDE
jgi:hypothetical protein